MARVAIAGMGSLGQEVPIFDASGNIVDYTQGDDGGGDVAPVVTSNPNPYYLPGLTPAPVYPSLPTNQIVALSPAAAQTLLTQPGYVAPGAISQAVSSLLSPGAAPSPRVSTLAPPSILTSSTLFPGIPDILTIGVIGLGLVMLTSGKKRR
jgi:hypothetical protein